MLRPLSLLLLALLTAAPSFAANPVVVVRVFVLKHRRAEEAALRVRPYRTETGSDSLDPVSKFLKEMGLGKIESLPSLKATRSSLPQETKVVVLDYQQG